MSPVDRVPGVRHRLRQFATLLVTSSAVLWVVIALVPGVTASGDASVVLAAAVLGLVSALLRPLLAALATRLGWVGVALVGLVAQVLIFWTALSITPGLDVSGVWSAFWASWLYALAVSAVTWVFDAGDDDLFLRDVLAHARQVPAGSRTGPPGVVFLQVDGLPAPLLRWAVQAGDLPTLSRWVRSGSHQLVGWHAQLPPTTPASQAGILHGRSDAVPAFRWYEKETGRLTVTSRPKDAAYVEHGMSDGRGLLAGGGVSVGNIFSGDAQRAVLTISAGHGHGPTREFAASYLRPFGFARSLLLTLGEMVKELYQGHQQQARGVEPRIDRVSSYVALRGVTNVLLRDLNVRLLAEQMLAGTPVMYCDFTDFDEVAHHAGPTRPESLASLAGIDRAIAVLERVAQVAPRPYELVVLSDHGQSQGATFLQRYGETLEQVVRQHLSPAPAAGPAPAGAPDGLTSVASTGRDEEWGPVATFLREVGTGHGPLARLGRRVLRRHESDHPEAAAAEPPDLVVTGSGNLGFVYFPRSPGRLSQEALERLHPGLLAALAQHDGVGFVVVRSESRGTVALGRDGASYVDEGVVEGVDPLAPFGPEAAEDVRRHGRLAHLGDIVVNSRIDEATSEVAAFEELVGSHGGLGGWQSEAVLVHPSGWSAPGHLSGADEVHRQLVRWLEELGQREELRGDPLSATSPG